MTAANSFHDAPARAAGCPRGLNAAVLVGGLSRRMGRPKHLLTIDGEPMLSRTVRVVRPYAGDVAVVGGADADAALAGLPPPIRTRTTWLPDERCGLGPVRGILAALLHDPARDWLVLGCDMPCVATTAIEWLLDQRARSPRAAAWFAARRGRIEPLLAVYSPRTAPALRASGATGLQAAIRRMPAHVAEIPAELFDCWHNANTPDEFNARPAASFNGRRLFEHAGVL